MLCNSPLASVRSLAPTRGDGRAIIATAEAEAMLDRRLWSLLRRDRRYLFASDATSQDARERELTASVVAEIRCEFFVAEWEHDIDA